MHDMSVKNFQTEVLEENVASDGPVLWSKMSTVN
jgi:hypothetical protein